MPQKPPFSITSKMLNLVVEISHKLGTLQLILNAIYILKKITAYALFKPLLQLKIIA